ncbi:hypothetical protein [Erythrobacter sp.]|uniref:hypothetical protein n=1 Tax=Erythrobacter sp. TaxID=1042 RepID=UPI0025EA8D54|nr:hypothetical protein [Erythrobacter sp.]
MTNIAKALLWAAAILIAALLQSRGLIAEDTAKLFIFVLPILAVLSLRSAGTCVRRSAS